MNECIEWRGRRDRDGYGMAGQSGKAHRIAYVEHHGLSLDDIKGLIVMHACDNPPCINVDHLRLGTQFDNMADMTRKGRRSMHRAILNEYAVKWIRSYYATGDYTQKELANMYGISRSAVSLIVNRKKWKHV